MLKQTHKPNAKNLLTYVFTQLFIGLIKGYRLLISPALGPRCRFYPSCSEYSLLAFQKFGLGKGFIKTVVRLSKCHPFHKGGVDLP